MSLRSKHPSPILGAATAMISEASSTLVTKISRFQHTFEASVNAIQPDPGQARKSFGDQDITSLAATMNERGQLQPILLRRNHLAAGQWLIVAGERRWRAAKLNGWSTILAIEHDGDPEVASLLENLQRVDLTPVEEARGLQRLIEGKGWTQDQAADVLGKSKSEISGTLRILTLPATLLDAVLTSELTLPKNTLVELARVEDPVARQQLFELAHNGTLTVKAIRIIKENIQQSLKESDSKSSAVRSGLISRGFTFQSLERVAQNLRNVRRSGRQVVGNERQYLELLRQEIDELLSVPKTGT